MGQRSKVSSSTKWRLGENVVLRLMKWLTPSVSFDILLISISHLLVCLPTLELTTFEQHVCSTKKGYANALSLRTNSCKKKKRTWPLWTAHIKQKSSVTLIEVGWNNISAIYIASSESCEPKTRPSGAEGRAGGFAP